MEMVGIFSTLFKVLVVGTAMGAVEPEAEEVLEESAEAAEMGVETLGGMAAGHLAEVLGDLERTGSWCQLTRTSIFIAWDGMVDPFRR